MSILKRNLDKKNLFRISISLQKEDFDKLLIIPFVRSGGIFRNSPKYFESRLSENNDEIFNKIMKAIEISRDPDAEAVMTSTEMAATNLKSYKDFSRKWIKISLYYDSKLNSICAKAWKRDSKYGSFIPEKRIDKIAFDKEVDKLSKASTVNKIRDMFGKLVKLTD